MAELHRYPLRVQQSKLDGWWFVFVDEVPGLEVFVQITKTCLTGRQSWQETYFVHAEKSFLIWKLFHQRTRHYTCPIKGAARPLLTGALHANPEVVCLH
jgi:hypothetical protein